MEHVQLGIRNQGGIDIISIIWDYEKDWKTLGFSGWIPMRKKKIDWPETWPKEMRNNHFVQYQHKDSIPFIFTEQYMITRNSTNGHASLPAKGEYVFHVNYENMLAHFFVTEKEEDARNISSMEMELGKAVCEHIVENVTRFMVFAARNIESRQDGETAFFEKYRMSKEESEIFDVALIRSSV
jgi:hypothetical protein